jgi:hypothetical protein
MTKFKNIKIEFCHRVQIFPDFVNAPPKSFADFLRFEKRLNSQMLFCEE